MGTQGSDIVAAGLGSTFDETVCVEELKERGDASSESFEFVGIGWDALMEMAEDVPVAKAVNVVLASHDRKEELEIVGVCGVDCPLVSSSIGGGTSECGEEFARLGRVVNCRERVYVALVGHRGDSGIEVEVGDALGHGVPSCALRSVSVCGRAIDLELSGIIDNGFDAEHEARFVIHLDPVLLHTVFDASSGPAFLEIVEDFSLEAGGKLSTEEGEDILGTEGEGGVTEELLVEILQGRAILEEDVGGIFGLVDDPVVSHAVEEPGKQWIDRLGEGAEEEHPVLLRKVVGELLGTVGVPDGGEGIVYSLVGDAGLIELAGKPLVAVEADLDDKGEPGLDADIHGSELCVDEVVIDAEPFSVVSLDVRSVLSGSDAEGRDRLDGGEDADKAVRDLVSTGDGGGLILFSEVAVEVAEGAAGSFGGRVSVSDDVFGELASKRLEVFVEDTLTVEEALNCLTPTEGKVATELNAVEA